MSSEIEKKFKVPQLKRRANFTKPAVLKAFDGLVKIGPKGERGEYGLPGRDGKDGRTIIGPQGLPGEPGKTPTKEELRPLIEQAVKEYPRMISKGGGGGISGIEVGGFPRIKKISFTGATVTRDSSGAAVSINTQSGTGDVNGPASSTDNAIARFDGAGGKTLQNSGIIVDDTDNITGIVTLNKVTITQPAASATLTIANTKTLTVNGDTTLTSGTHSGTNTGDQTNITGNAGTVTGFTPASGSLTLSGADALTLTTTADTNVTLPTTGTLATLAGTETLTNKRINSRVQSVTDAATVTPAGDSDDCVDITALAQAVTIAAPTGTPVNFQKLIIRFKDNATARAITWNAAFVAGGVALPSTTTLSKILTVGFIYNTANALNKWQCVASSNEA